MIEGRELTCVQCEYNESKKKATLTYFEEETGKIYEVGFNRQSYKDNKYVDDPEKAAKIDEMIKEDLGEGVTFDTLGTVVGKSATVYVYNTFSSLHPVDVVEKFTKEMVGDVYNTQIKEIVDGDYAIKIRYEINGVTYESKMVHGKWLEPMKRWAYDDIKREKQYKKFEEKFLVPIARKDELIGKKIMVEVKTAFGQAIYGDIKKLKK